MLFSASTNGNFRRHAAWCSDLLEKQKTKKSEFWFPVACLVFPFRPFHSRRSKKQKCGFNCRPCVLVSLFSFVCGSFPLIIRTAEGKNLKCVGFLYFILFFSIFSFWEGRVATNRSWSGFKGSNGQPACDFFRLWTGSPGPGAIISGPVCLNDSQCLPLHQTPASS